MTRGFLHDTPARLTGWGLVAIAVVAALGCNPAVRERAPQDAPGEPSYPISIRDPGSLGSIAVESPAGDTQKMQIGCATCHSLREGAPVPQSTQDLDEFHVGLIVRHGDLACASCHDPAAPQSLRLATGERLSSRDVMRLCSQCHGPQKRDYDRGAHGGMEGYWDLSRGPRIRNHCVQCHAPHTPAYRGGHPVLPPRDRFAPTHGGGR